jgi:V8-like Glu-specific endopeptidase
MRRSGGLLAVVFAFVLALCGGASAVVGGSPDNDAHPYVGAAMQHQVHGGVSGTELCSGFLISPTKFVTAAHCFDPNGDPISVTFAENARTTSTSVGGTVVNAPDLGYPVDVAVITLDAPQNGLGVGVPGTAAKNDLVDVVGYGISDIAHKAPLDFGSRQVATTRVASAGSLGDVFLKLLADPGACQGDSGGPNLLHGTSTVVAITTAGNGNPNCNGVSYSLRLDNPAVQAFLTSQLS